MRKGERHIAANLPTYPVRQTYPRRRDLPMKTRTDATPPCHDRSACARIPWRIGLLPVLSIWAAATTLAGQPVSTSERMMTSIPHARSAQLPAYRLPMASSVKVGSPAIRKGGVPTSAQSGGHLVGHCLDDGSSDSLRAVVAQAASGDTVDLRQLQCSQITLVQGQIEIHVDDLNISGPGEDHLILDGDNADRIFRHTGSGALAISGLTLKRGRVVDQQGGCISSDDGSVSLSHTTVTECSVHRSDNPDAFMPWGGGVFAAANITAIDSTVSDNTVSSDIASVDIFGGGLASWITKDGHAGNITLIRSRIRNNQIQTGAEGFGHAAGGGVHSVSTVEIMHSEVSGNEIVSTFSDPGEQSSTEGGGIAAPHVRIADSVIRGNSITNTQHMSNTGGGGIAATGVVNISRSSIIENRSNMFAAGLMHNGIVAGVSELHIGNSTFSGNHADLAAGAIMSYPATIILNSTVAYNIVDDESPMGVGGVLFAPLQIEHALTLNSSIIHRNLATNASGFAEDLAVLDEMVATAGSSNLIGESSGTELPSDTLNEGPLLLPLVNNGGSGFTHALSDGSPAIDAGHNDAGFDFDQRGAPYVRMHGAETDIGALESQPLPTADLSLDLTGGPGQVQPGDTFDYVLTVTNDGPSQAAATTLDIDLADALTLEASNGCNEDPDGVPVCSLGVLPAGESREVVLSVVVTGGAGGQTMVSVGSGAEDPDGANNEQVSGLNVVFNIPVMGPAGLVLLIMLVAGLAGWRLRRLYA